MVKTFQEVLKHVEEHDPHKITPGRKSAYTVQDMLDKGQTLLQNTMKIYTKDTTDDVDNEVELGDVMVEL